ncbi:large subunit ribosomal protein L6 [Bacilli bacterium PM5-3]|nr:large subunit ribosomal protein L6 [Bacilli bacterium PM5-3]MDH6604199.1 large subunit ribosomal protein L6 [Bacilli bacterium PM5-9]
MSRIGNQVINVPAGVEITIADNNNVSVKGPKGTLEQTFSADMAIELNDGQLTVKRPTEQKHHKQLHGTTRALLANMVVGVTEGYKIDLEIVGLGYRATMQGKKLVLSVGYSHPVEFDIVDGVTVEVPSQTEISISGINKQIVGEFAANVRATRKPEPYKGKGIRYKGEQVKRKEGKKAGK